MMKKWKKRILALGLGIVMTVNLVIGLINSIEIQKVYAYDNVKEFPDFDVDTYVADLMCGSIHNNLLSRYIMWKLNEVSPSTSLVRAADNDTVFQVGLKMWEISTFEVSDLFSDGVSLVNYYESIILGTLRSEMGTSYISNKFNSDFYKYNAKFFSIYKNILETKYNFNTGSITNCNELDSATQNAINDAIEETFKTKFPKINNVGTFIKQFNFVTKTGANIENAIGRACSYMQCYNLVNSMKSVIYDLYNNCDDSTADGRYMKAALMNIKGACEDYITNSLSAAVDDLYMNEKNLVASTVVDDFIGKFFGKNPYVSAFFAGQSIGKGLANVVFATDNVCEQYYKMQALAMFEILLKDIVQFEMNNFKSNGNKENAEKVLEVVKLLYSEYDISCDMAKEYADVVYNKGLINCFKSKDTEYIEFCNLVETQKEKNEKEYAWLTGKAWLDNLKNENYDIYSAFVYTDECEFGNPIGSNGLVTWDCVWFGYYPQTIVDSSEEIYAQLQNSVWNANNDTKINHIKYRRVKSDISDEYNYFRYEPIKWRVLEVEDGRAVLVSDVVLDKFKDYLGQITYREGDKYYQIIRSWLNGYNGNENFKYANYTKNNFIDTAFEKDEQEAIISIPITCYGESFCDKVYMLSVENGITAKHGFGYVNTRATIGTDYFNNCKSSGDYVIWYSILEKYDKSMYPFQVPWEPKGSPYIGRGANEVSKYNIRPSITIDISKAQTMYAGKVGTLSENYEVNKENYVYDGMTSDLFDLKRDGYSFANSYASFGYEATSKYPFDIYMELYGYNYNWKKYLFEGYVSGNCGGMTITSILFKEGLLDKNIYMNTNNLGSVNEKLHSGVDPSGSYVRADKDSSLVRLIEKYQLWQFTDEADDIIFGNPLYKYEKEECYFRNQYNSLEDAFEKCLGDNYLLGVIGQNVAHAFVINTAKPIEDLGGGWHRVYLYDPNTPYEKNVLGWDVNECLNIYIDINYHNGHFKIDASNILGESNFRIGYTDDDRYIIGSELYIVDYHDFPTEISPNSYIKQEDKTKIKVNASNLTVKYATGKEAFVLGDGTLLYKDDSVVVKYGLNSKSTEIFNGIIILPKDAYTFEFDSAGAVQVTNENYYIGLVGNIGSNVVVSPEGSTIIEGNKENEVNVLIEETNIEDDESWMSVNTQVTNKNGTQTTVSLKKGKINIESIEDSFDIRITSSQEPYKDYVLENMSVKEINNKNIVEYAKENGKEIITRILEESDIEIQENVIFDGLEHQIVPKVKYGDKELIEGVDYTVSGDTIATMPGTYTITVEGIGDYINCVSKTYTIESGLKFTGISLTLYSSLALNYKVEKELLTNLGYINPYVIFELNGVKTKITSYKETDDAYIFSFKNLAPNQMNDVVYATLYAYNGDKLYGGTRLEYSIAKYCNSIFTYYSGDEYSKLRTLIVDLMNYGEKSQIYTNYNIDNLVTNRLTDEQASWATKEEPELKSLSDVKYETIEAPSVLWTGVGLNLKDSITLRLKISTEDVSNLKIKVETVSKVCLIDDLMLEKTDGGYYFYFSDLEVSQLSEPIYFTVYKGEQQVSDKLRYSIESYAYAVKDTGDENLVELVNAMMKYGNSAVSYIK